MIRPYFLYKLHTVTALYLIGISVIITMLCDNPGI